MASSGDAESNGKKPVWNVPSSSNGSIDVVASVIDSEHWPALSEAATKASPKSSSESLKSLTDASPPPGPAAPFVQTPKLNPIPNPPVGAPVRQRSFKRGAGSSSNGVATLPEAAPPQNPDPSPRGAPRSPHGDQPRAYGGRRGNNGGGMNNNYGARRSHDWQQNAYMHQRGGGRSYPRAAAPVTAPYAGPPPPIRPPFVMNPVGYSELQSPSLVYVAPPPLPDALRVVPPFVQPPHPLFVLDPQRLMLLKQIDYYFSPENLCKDMFLRQNMDKKTGWVPISLIAGFNRVTLLTNNIQYIVETMCMSTIVEVDPQGEKIRKRYDWDKWLPPSGPSTPTIEESEAVAARLQNLRVDGKTAQHYSNGGPLPTDAALTRSASMILNSQVNAVGDSSGESNGQITGSTGSDRSTSSRSLERSDTL